MNKEEIIFPPVCKGIYSKNYALRFMSNNPCIWLGLGYIEKKSNKVNLNKTRLEEEV